MCEDVRVGPLTPAESLFGSWRVRVGVVRLQSKSPQAPRCLPVPKALPPVGARAAACRRLSELPDLPNWDGRGAVQTFTVRVDAVPPSRCVGKPEGERLLLSLSGHRSAISDRHGDMDLIALIPVFEDEGTALIRTEFSDDAAWVSVVAAVTARVIFNEPDPEVPGDDGGYSPYIVPIDDPAFADLDALSLADAWRPHREEATGYALLADAQSIREVVGGEELTVVYVDLHAADGDGELGWIFGQSFRCVAREVAGIESNLSIANLDFSDFADYARDGDGVFRGFSD